MPTDRDLIELQAETLFTHDEAGRICLQNDGAVPGERAPRFFFGRTRVGHTWRFRHDLSEALVRRLEELASAEPISSDLRADPACLDQLRAALASCAPIQREFAGPAYRFPDTIGRPDGVVAITAANAEILRENFSDLIETLHILQPCMAIVRDGAAVSVCFSSRLPGRAVEAGVNTSEGFRGRGYAAAATAAWALAVRERGVIPLYSTSWDNLASQGVARRLGLIMYGTDLSAD
jgi:RimJ/RimL family protein N-acetyltransferase